MAVMGAVKEMRLNAIAWGVPEEKPFVVHLGSPKCLRFRDDPSGPTAVQCGT